MRVFGSYGYDIVIAAMEGEVGDCPIGGSCGCAAATCGSQSR